MVIVYRPNVPGSTVVPRSLSYSVLDCKNATSGLEKVPSTTAKKRFAAKLRKIRWRIYRDIDLMKGNIKKSLKYYEKQVHLFLKDFSKKLKPKEPSIWKEKVAKTSVDVHAFQRNKKIEGNCASCSMKNVLSIDAALLMLSAAYHFVKANRAAFVKRNIAEYHDVEIDEVESGDDIVAPAENKMKESEAVVNVLDDETTSAANVIKSEKEEFRKRAWAIYNAPSVPDPFRFWPMRRL